MLELDPRPGRSPRPLLALAILLVLATADSAAAAESDEGTLSPDERTRVIEALQDSALAVRELLEPMTPEQLAFRPREGAWSTAQVVEHLRLVEDEVRRRIVAELLASSPVTPRSSKLHDATIRMALTNRSARRFTAPAELSPRPDVADRAADVLDRFARSRAETLELARVSEDPLRARLLAHPLLGEIDGYQWLLFLAAHTERHVDQIREIAGTGAFPGRGRLTADDRSFLIDHLQATRRMLEQELAGLEEEHLRFAEEGRWSIRQVVEHLAAAEGALVELVRERVLSTPARPEMLVDGLPVVGDRSVILTMTNRAGQRFEAPPALQPKEEDGTGEALALFEQRRGATIQYVETTADALRAHFWRNDVLGLLDGYQWLLLLSAHTARHTDQIREVKAALGFPAP